MKIHSLVVASSFVILAAVASAKNPSYTFKINVKEQDRYEYVAKVAINGGEGVGTAKLQIHTAQRALKVTSDEVNWSMYIAGSSANGTGMMAAVKDALSDMKGVSFTRSTDLLGKVKSFNGGGGAAMQALQSSSPDLQFPTKPVEIGEVWESSFEMQGSTVKMKNKLVSVDGTHAKVVSEAESSSEEMKMTAPYEYIVDLNTGMLVSSKGAASMNQMGMQIGLTFTLERLVPVQPRFPVGFASTAFQVERLARFGSVLGIF
jgi:hypothetical protein